MTTTTTANTTTTVNTTSQVDQQLTYRELQAKLKELKVNGHDVTVKLNSKYDVLLQEYSRLVAAMEQDVQQVLNSTQEVEVLSYNSRDTTSELNTTCKRDCYPFTSNTVKVENVILPSTNSSIYYSRTLPAMNSKLAPSWLARPQKVYVVDGIDYLPYELEQQLQGQCCEVLLQCSTHIVDIPEESVTVEESVTAEEYAQPKSSAGKVERAWHHYINQQDSTVKQAAANGVEILRCTKAFISGFMTGLSKTGRADLRKHKANC